MAKEKRPKPASIQNLQEDLRLALKSYCEDQGRTMAWSIVDMITKYLPPEYLPPEK